MVALIDFETRSACSIKAAGAHAYAEHPTTEFLYLAWHVDGSAGVVGRGEQWPPLLLSAIASGAVVWAWNVQFDRQIYNRFRPRGWPELPIEQTADVMALAAICALPLGLGDCAAVLGVEVQKDDIGEGLKTKYCGPVTVGPMKGQFHEITTADDWLWRKYAADDVGAALCILRALPPMPEGQRAWWLCEQRINDRGFRIDAAGIAVLKRLAAADRADISAKLTAWTGGRITAPTQAARILTYINEVDPELGLTTLAKLELADALKRANPEAKRVLQARREGGRSSLAKADAMLVGANADQRCRGTMQFHGAATGREAGRRVQPQNMVRPDEAWTELGLTPSSFGGVSTADAVHFIRAIYDGGVTGACTSMLRNLIIAEPDKVLIAGDFSGVEARVNACLAGETSKLDAFRRVDAGEADDIYCTTASGIYGYEVKKKTHKVERQVGKIAELASGFGGSVGAWKRFGADKLGWSDDDILDKVRAWRASHPRIRASWGAYQATAVLAMLTPDVWCEVPNVYRIAYRYHTGYGMLQCRLPSGRIIYYFRPEVCLDRFDNPTFSFRGMEQLENGSRVWVRKAAYGGMLCENVVQAVSADLMTESAIRFEAAGWPIVLTVHDEIVCEMPDAGRGHLIAECERIMEVSTDWSVGWPIRAEAWAAKEYRK